MGSSPEINNSLTIAIINVFMVDLRFRLDSSLLFIKDLNYHIEKRGVVVCSILVCKVSTIYILSTY